MSNSFSTHQKIILRRHFFENVFVIGQQQLSDDCSLSTAQNCSMKLDAYGRMLEVVKEDGEWILYQLGEGKRSRSTIISIPSEYTEEEVISFLEDMFHEAATPQNPKIKRLD